MSICGFHSKEGRVQFLISLRGLEPIKRIAVGILRRHQLCINDDNVS